jgi:hypothetical protein
MAKEPQMRSMDTENRELLPRWVAEYLANLIDRSGTGDKNSHSHRWLPLAIQARWMSFIDPLSVVWFAFEALLLVKVLRHHVIRVAQMPDQRTALFESLRYCPFSRAFFGQQGFRFLFMYLRRIRLIGTAYFALSFF